MGVWINCKSNSNFERSRKGKYLVLTKSSPWFNVNCIKKIQSRQKFMKLVHHTWWWISKSFSRNLFASVKYYDCRIATDFFQQIFFSKLYKTLAPFLYHKNASSECQCHWIVRWWRHIYFLQSSCELLIRYFFCIFYRKV